jgi:hypothetical protein
MSWLSIVLIAELATYLGIDTDCAYNRKHDEGGFRWDEWSWVEWKSHVIDSLLIQKVDIGELVRPRNLREGAFN